MASPELSVIMERKTVESVFNRFTVACGRAVLETDRTVILISRLTGCPKAQKPASITIKKVRFLNMRIQVAGNIFKTGN
jgi:hypothetical protein